MIEWAGRLAALAAFCSVAASVVYAVRRSAVTAQVAWTLVIATFFGGAALTVLALTSSFHTVSSVAPADKATILAASISEAMNASAFSIGALLLSAPGIVVGEVRRRRR